MTASVLRLCSVDDRMINLYGEASGTRIGRRNRSTRKKPPSMPLCPTKIPHDLWLNPDCRSEKSASNRLSYGPDVLTDCCLRISLVSPQFDIRSFAQKENQTVGKVEVAAFFPYTTDGNITLLQTARDTNAYVQHGSKSPCLLDLFTKWRFGSFPS
jgi:hypothetical protein